MSPLRAVRCRDVWRPLEAGLYIVLTKWHAGHMSDPLPPERPFHHSAIGNVVGR